MRRIALAATLTLLAAACGGDSATATSTTAPTTTITTTGIAPTTLTGPSTTSTAAPSGPTDCAEIWPESLVQEVVGPSVGFVAANADASACTYLGDSGGVALAWRTSSLADYEQGRTASSATGEVVDRDVCDAAYSIEPGGFTFIMEAYSEANQRTYTATISGGGPEVALIWATELLRSAC
ncbi:MAG TPA: hypothetical protein VK960_04325 [Acidimicrobiia bacterium]|nr:hypothetical protein [Acidimicrobiia bacterium]